MCFEVQTLLPPEGVANGNKAGDDKNDDLGIMDIDENDNKSGNFSWFLLLPCPAWNLSRTTILLFCRTEFCRSRGTK